MTEKEEYEFGSKVLARFFGDEKFPVEWVNENDKKLMWWYDDLHVPHPISPLFTFFLKVAYTSCGNYMYRRFWAPFGKYWPVQYFNSYVYPAIVPRDPEEAKRVAPYYLQAMPIYAAKFLEWWNSQYLPEIQRNYEFVDKYPYEEASLMELMILLEDYSDIYERLWRLHWILNLAQFQSFLQFRGVYQETFGKLDEEEIGKVLVSVWDKNWESIEGLWKLKERVKTSSTLRKYFEKITPEEILSELKRSNEGREFLKELNEYLKIYGNKAIFAHELMYPTWREILTPAIELTRSYLVMDYDYPEDIKRCREERDKAVEQMLAKVKDEDKRKKLKEALDSAIKMAPLTPDHHFYIDQASHARLRRICKEIGERLKNQKIVNDTEDVFFLEYDEVKEIAANPKAFDAKARVAERRKQRDEASKLRPPDWIGTATQWAVYEEPYKGLWGFPQKFDIKARVKPGITEIKGIAASVGVVEGTAKVVMSIAEFDKVQTGDIMICEFTNPAWIAVFPKIKGLVTDAGGILSHPGIVAREFGIPCVVGTSIATEAIKSGQRIRVDGSRGIVELLTA